MALRAPLDAGGSKVLVISDTVGGWLWVLGGWSQVSGASLGGGGHRVYLLMLGTRERSPPAGNPDTHLSSCSWAKALVVADVLGEQMGVW